jgi:hypothetical protein
MMTLIPPSAMTIEPTKLDFSKLHWRALALSTSKRSVALQYCFVSPTS